MVQQGSLAEVLGGGVLCAPSVPVQAAGKAVAGAAQVVAGDFLAALQMQLQVSPAGSSKAVQSADPLKEANDVKPVGIANDMAPKLASSVLKADLPKVDVPKAAMHEVEAAWSAGNGTVPVDCAPLQSPALVAQTTHGEVQASQAGPLETGHSAAERELSSPRVVMPRSAAEIDKPVDLPVTKMAAAKADKRAERETVKEVKSASNACMPAAGAPAVSAQAAPVMHPVVVSQPEVGAGPVPAASVSTGNQVLANNGPEVPAVVMTGKNPAQKKSSKEGVIVAETPAVKGHTQAVAVPAELRHEAVAAKAGVVNAPAQVALRTQDVASAVTPHSTSAAPAKTDALVESQPATRAARTEPVAHGYWQEPDVVKTFASTPKVLEVGLSDGGHGWLRVRAQAGDAGEISASLVATSSGQAEDLRRKLPGISEYLASESVGVSSLVVNAGNAGNAWSSAADSSTNSGMGASLSGSGQPGQGARRDDEQAGARLAPAYATEVPLAEDGASMWAGVTGLNRVQGNRSGGWLSVLA